MQKYSQNIILLTNNILKTTLTTPQNGPVTMA